MLGERRNIVIGPKYTPLGRQGPNIALKTISSPLKTYFSFTCNTPIFTPLVPFCINFYPSEFFRPSPSVSLVFPLSVFFIFPIFIFIFLFSSFHIPSAQMTSAHIPSASFCPNIYPCCWVQEIKQLEPDEVPGFVLVHGRSLTDILREYVG